MEFLDHNGTEAESSAGHPALQEFRMPLTDPASLAARRTFEPADVFFSTTDRKGVIAQANHTFLRLAALTQEQAIGSAHNVIRHPEMPGGAFRLIWDELEAGRPVAAYIANQAADGLRYDVLAAIIPIDGGYLSVRLRPNLGDTERRVFEAYDAVTHREKELRESGASRHSVAERGAVLLTRALATIGYGSFEAFTRTVLPREVEALVASLPPAVAPGADAGTLGDVLSASQAISSATADVMSSVRGLEEAALRVALDHDNLDPVVRELDGMRHDLAHIATLLRDAASAQGEPDGELASLIDLTSAIDTWCDEAIDGLASAPLQRLQAAIRDLALRVAMFTLLNQMIARFTQEVMESGPSGAPHGAEMRQLAAALAQQFERAEAAHARVNELLQVVPELTEIAVESIDRVGAAADDWAQRIAAAAASGLLGEVGPEVSVLAMVVSDSLTQGAGEVGDIVGLSQSLRESALAFDPNVLRAPLAQIADGVAELP